MNITLPSSPSSGASHLQTYHHLVKSTTPPQIAMRTPFPSILFSKPIHPLKTPHYLAPRHLTTTPPKMSATTPQPVFSSSYDPTQATKDLSPLLRGTGGKWGLIDSGKGVERSFKFKTFKKTWVCHPFFTHYQVPDFVKRISSGDIDLGSSLKVFFSYSTIGKGS